MKTTLQEKQWAAISSVIAAFGLTVFKLVATLITAFAVNISGKPADTNAASICNCLFLLKIKGKYSIRINNQYRIVFEFRDKNVYEVEIVDYH
jgi:hypothetical protein